MMFPSWKTAVKRILLQVPTTEELGTTNLVIQAVFNLSANVGSACGFICRAWGIVLPALLTQEHWLLWSLWPGLASIHTGTNFWVASDLIYEWVPTQANKKMKAAQMAKVYLYKEHKGKIKNLWINTFCSGNHIQQLENVKIFFPVWRCVDVAPFPRTVPEWRISASPWQESERASAHSHGLHWLPRHCIPYTLALVMSDARSY